MYVRIFFTGIKLGVDARILGEWWMSPTKPSNFSWNIAFMLQGPHQGSPGHHDRPPRGRKRENQPVVWEYSLGISWFFLLRTEWGYGGNILWEDGNVMEHHGIYKQPCSFEFNKPEMDGIVHFVAIP
jgi:hypothetical protein